MPDLQFIQCYILLVTWQTLYNYPAELPSETLEVLAFQGGKSYTFQVCVMQHFVQFVLQQMCHKLHENFTQCNTPLHFPNTTTVVKSRTVLLGTTEGHGKSEGKVWCDACYTGQFFTQGVSQFC